MKKTIFLGLAMLFAALTFAQNNRSAAEVFLQLLIQANITCISTTNLLRLPMAGSVFTMYTIMPQYYLLFMAIL